MCGVCGIVHSAAPELDGEARRVVDAMVEALAHRGPDDVGVCESAQAILGATRLAIRGLGGGSQPIADPQSGVLAVCNGEIDNSESLRDWLEERGRRVEQLTDVAVIPGLYLELGEDFVERLAGAFAIGLWDPRQQRLLLARDRSGERSLFYVTDGATLHFATEISALATKRALTLTPDKSALARFLRFGSFTAPETPFEEIRKVCPAELVIFENGRLRRRRYWRWGITQRTKAAPSLDAFDVIFRKAVHRHSEIEVDFGAFLSGGVDSSLVTAVARQVRPEQNFKTYTLRFEENSFDEGSFAEQVADYLGVESVPVWVRAEDFPKGIRDLIRMVGEPLADPAWVPTALLARRAAEDVKLALVGEGADEIFGGYPTYIGARYAERFMKLPRAVRGMITRAVDLWPPSDKKVTLSFLLKRFVAGVDLDGLSRHLLWTSNLPPELLRRLSLPGADTRLDQAAARFDLMLREADSGGGSEDEAADLLDLIQRLDLETSLAEGLLTKADRASMKSALELRAPFLDREVLDYAASFPETERVRGIKTKVFLKSYALRYLPAGIVNRKKRGLSVPLSLWLKGPLRPWAESRLQDQRLEQAGLNPRAALDLLSEHLAGKADHARALWSLLVLDEWLRWAEERPGSVDAVRAPLTDARAGG